MKILLPIEQNNGIQDSKVCNLFGAKNACIYNSNDNTCEWILMQSISKKDGNLSIELKRKGITTVICSSIPLLALDLFKASGFKLYKASVRGAADNIKDFHKNKLEILTHRNALEETCNSNSCASCSSAC